MLETLVVKLEKQIEENSDHECKNIPIMVGTIPNASH